MTAEVMQFNNLFKLLKAIEEERPEVAERIVADAKELATIVGNDAEALAKLVNETTAEITRFIDQKTLRNVNEILERKQ